MSNHDELGDRMKRYENVSRYYLTRRCPVCIRVDGKAFHSYTRGLEKPFDRALMTAMQGTMLKLCQEIQGCVFGYTQSDEITLVLTDYATVHTDAWFGYNIQKMASVSASIATLEFNRLMKEEWGKIAEVIIPLVDGNPTVDTEAFKRSQLLVKKLDMAMFDSRVFSVPKDEVCNCLIWRQQDATRNSIEAAGHANFSQSQLHGKTCNEIQELLFQKGINWNDYPTDCKRGSACYRVKRTVVMEDPRNPGREITVERNAWEVDREIPIFTQSRDFVERWL